MDHGPTQQAPPVVDVVIVSYNSATTLAGAVSSARSAQGVAKVVVVDNHSADGSAEVAWEAGAVVIEAGKNLGFAAANNLGVTHTQSAVLLFLNPDAQLPPQGAAALAQALAREPGLGVAALPMTYPGGAPQQSAFAFPTLTTLFWQNLGLLGVFTRLGWLKQPQQGEVDWVLGACLAMRREVFGELGGWDERFFLYQEDTDLCRRARARGYQVRVLSGPTVTHVGKSPGTDHGPATVLFNQAILTYFRIHHGALGAWLAALLFTLGHSARWLVFGLSGRGERRRFEGKNAVFFMKRLAGKTSAGGLAGVGRKDEMN